MDGPTFSLVIGIFLSMVGVLATIIGNRRNDRKLDKLKTDYAELERLNHELEENKELLKKKLPNSQVHTILLDGMSGAGKSTIAARFSNPALTFEDLRSIIAATDKEHVTKDMPLCWNGPNSKITLNTIRFFDVAGENAGTVVNALLALTEEPSTRDNVKFKNKEVVLLVVWDLSASIEENQSYLSEHRLRAVYGNKLARESIKSIVVFFNKADGPDIDQDINKSKQCIEYVQRLFGENFEQEYGEIIFCVGSAKRGNGLHDCYGQILKRLDLAGHFADHNPHLAL